MMLHQSRDKPDEGNVENKSSFRRTFVREIVGAGRSPSCS